MTLVEMAQACADAIEAGRGVVLVVPGGPPRGERVRLIRSNPRRQPMGVVLSWTEEGTVAVFDPLDVLAYLVAHGRVLVEPLIEERSR